MTTPTRTDLNLEVSDVTGQNPYRVEGVAADNTVGELIHELVRKMDLQRNDSAQRPITYRARLEREGRHLNASELVGDAVRDGDQLTLQPNIDAGGTEAWPRRGARSHRDD